MFHRLKFLVLIVCQDPLAYRLPVVQSVFSRHEHQMQEYSKCRVYQMNMVF